MAADAVAPRRGRGRPKKSILTADEMLTQLAVLNLSEFAQLTGMDPSTVLRKEREGVIPRRRDLAGRLVFLTREVREWMDGAPVADGADPEKSARSRKAREIALARGAGRAA